MSATARSFPVLCFRAGETTLGVAAEEVVAVEAANAAAPYIGALMSIESERSMRYQRTLWLAHGAGVMKFIVDNPIYIHQVMPADVMPIGVGLSLVRWQPVIGFSRLGDRVVLLLDTQRLIQAFIDQRRGGSS